MKRMKDDAHYTIQIIEIPNTGVHGIVMKDNDTDKYLNMYELADWIEFIGGYDRQDVYRG
jgi:hypothetical protein